MHQPHYPNIYDMKKSEENIQPEKKSDAPDDPNNADGAATLPSEAVKNAQASGMGSIGGQSDGLEEDASANSPDDY